MTQPPYRKSRLSDYLNLQFLLWLSWRFPPVRFGAISSERAKTCRERTRKDPDRTWTWVRNTTLFHVFIFVTLSLNLLLSLKWSPSVKHDDEVHELHLWLYSFRQWRRLWTHSDRHRHRVSISSITSFVSSLLCLVFCLLLLFSISDLSPLSPPSITCSSSSCPRPFTVLCRPLLAQL